MNTFPAPLVLAVASTFFLAGIVKGVTGMGLPTVAMGLLGTLMPPVVAAALLIVPSFVTNVLQLLTGPRLGALAARLWLLLLGIIVGTLAGSRLLVHGGAGWLTTGLGAALMVYAGLGLSARQMTVPQRLESRWAPLVGLTTGVITGGTGVFVIPAVPFIQALGLGKEELIQALGLSFTVSTMALAAGLAGGGAFRLNGLGWSSLAVAPALLGMWVGGRVRLRVSEAKFRRWFLICLWVLGLDLALRRFLC
jgi:uncharacterized membrane protein YfcA